MSSLKLAWATARITVRNFFVARYNTWIENRRYHYSAIKEGGGGVVPLGRVNMKEAREATAKFGSVIYFDVEHHVVMYRDNHKLVKRRNNHGWI